VTGLEQASPQTTGPKRAEGREFVLLVTTIMALGGLSIDLLLPALPRIRAEFNMEPGSSKVTWVITSYFLGLAIGPWLFGPPSDRFGRKPLLNAGLVLYAIGAITASFAPSFQLLVIARFVWGVGAAAPRSLAVAMIRDRYAGEQMARLMSLIMAVFILVPIAAPAFGTVLIAVSGWRSVLWVPCVAAAIVAAWAWRRLPETLAPERRRPFNPAAVLEAAKLVVTNRSTMYFTLAITALFGVMAGYLSSSELILDKVYGYAKWFPFFFGGVAVLLGVGALTSARFVGRLGLYRWTRRLSFLSVASTTLFAVIVAATHGRPNFWLMTVSLAMAIPFAQNLIPNCNTAAMVPMGHVAGMASTIMGTVTIAGGALIGNRIAGAFDGTVTPFAVSMLLAVLFAFAMIRLATRTTTADLLKHDITHGAIAVESAG
jgi:MFS transporter, DHA1 family, multidrug resistance protein